MAALTLIIGNKNYSSWSLRPWLALRQVGLDFEEIRIPLYQEGAATQLRHYSPAGKVPILQHGAITVWDSLAILEYVAEQFPDRPWWPQDPVARAIARSISAEMHSGFFQVRQHMPMNIRATYPNRTFTAETHAEVDRITAIWRECRQTYGRDGDFLFGPFAIADAMYAPVVFRFRTYGIPLDPVCQAYADTILALPALQPWITASHAEAETLPQYEFA